mmetsp:Transcript_25357/g.74000  ORF Transcript_25357/g.74000 Transcript_25357/m.74000 type:complete len:213 (+) Transcript_25357:617-1255(+)
MAARFAGVSMTVGRAPRTAAPSGRPEPGTARDWMRWCVAAFAMPYPTMPGVGWSAASAPTRTRVPPGRRRRQARCAAVTAGWRFATSMLSTEARPSLESAPPPAHDPAVHTTASKWSRPSRAIAAWAASSATCALAAAPQPPGAATTMSEVAIGFDTRSKLSRLAPAARRPKLARTARPRHPAPPTTRALMAPALPPPFLEAPAFASCQHSG